MSIFTTKQEENVYKALLENKDSSVIALAKKMGIHRPHLYKILNNLIQDGLIKTTEHGKRLVYSITSREILEEKIENAKKEIDKDAKLLLTLVNELQTVTNIHGRQAIMNLFDDVTRSIGERNDYYSFTTKSDAINLENYFSDTFRKNRDRKDLWSHVLTDKPVDLKKGVRFNLEIKQVTTTSLEQDCLWIMYGDTYAFVDFKTESGYIVKNKRLAKFQKDIFTFFYNKM